MAIVHVVMKSSSQAPPAAAHAEYIARDGQYERRGGLELVESGNMPEFARENPSNFWVAADAHERKNGRAYTELQIALPRELSVEERHALARETTRELMGDRFAYTMAVHTPLAKDNIEQPHMHLMFSERVVDSNTQSLPEDRFFKRNGAKKDPEWNSRDKPMEVREKWVEMMNAAMERHGHIQHPDQRLDARSWADQGRHDLAELVEPKLRGVEDAKLRALHAQVDALREQRAELPEAHLAPAQAIEKIEEKAEQQIAEVREREAQELSRLDKLIAAAREFAHEVKDRTVAFARDAKEWAGSLFGREPKEELVQAAKEQEEARPPTPEMQQRLDALVAGVDRKLSAHDTVEARLADFDRRMEEKLQAQDQALAPDKSLGKEAGPKHEHGFGIEM